MKLKAGGRIVASMMAVVLAVGLMPLPAFAAPTTQLTTGAAMSTQADELAYVDAEGNSHTVSSYEQLTGSTGGLTAEWYAVSGSVSKTDISIPNDAPETVNIVLCDGATLTTNGFTMADGKTLRIWSQSVVQPPADAAEDYDAYNDASVTTGRLLTKKYGIRVQEGRSVEINGGVIKADTSEGGRAGIGGNSGHSAGNITINGGVIYAWGTDNAAGIGGGWGGNGGNITINGGRVWTKPDAEDGAGIGGGNGADGGNITINGGVVIANGSWSSAGIGGGYHGSGGTINITGGTVTATGAKSSAGIGAGNETSDCGDITITGGTVIANGGSYGAGIGGGYRDSTKHSAKGSITISGGIVKASGGENAAGIGGGLRGAVESITITGGQVNATGNYRGAGIGGGSGRGFGTITIENAPLVYATSQFGAGIGTGGAAVADSDPDVVYGHGSISMTNSNVVGISYSGGAGIGGGIFGYADSITISGGSTMAQGGATYEIGEIPLLVMLVAMGEVITLGGDGNIGLMSDLSSVVKQMQNTPGSVITQAQNVAVAGLATAVSKFFGLFGGSKDDVDVIFYTGAAIGGGYRAQSGTIRIADQAVVQCAAGMLPTGLQKGSPSAAIGPGAGNTTYDVQIYPEALVTTARIDVYQDTYEGVTIRYIPITNDGNITGGAESGDLVATKNYAEIRSAYKSFGVVYNANGGKGSMDVQWFDRSATESKALSPNKFTKSGVSFGGWIEVDPSTGQPVIDEATGQPKFYKDQFAVTATTFTKPLTVLAAYWVEPTSVIKYYDNEEIANARYTQIIQPGTKVKIVAPLTAGKVGADGYFHTVTGWKVKGSDSDTVYKAGDWIDVNQLIEEQQGKLPIELVPIQGGQYHEPRFWHLVKNNHYARMWIRYTANGGVDSDVYDFTASDYQYLTILSGTIFTREGYKFTKWHVTDSSGYDQMISPSVRYNKSFSNPNFPTDRYELTAEAVWTPNTYKVVFDANGGEGAMSNEGFTYDADKPLDKNQYTRDGYEFIGWNTEPDGSGTQYADEQVVKNLASKGSVTLYAQWHSDSVYVTFDSNDPDNPDAEKGYQSFLRGEEKALRSNSGDGAFITRDHYAFTGWNTEPDGTGTAYADGATVNFADDTTLYAQWALADSLVTFDANVPEGETAEGDMSAQYVAPGTAPKLTANTFTCENYTFESWNTAADGSGTSYADTQEIELAEVTELTLYAQWKHVPVTVTYMRPKYTQYDPNVLSNYEVLTVREAEYGADLQPLPKVWGVNDPAYNHMWATRNPETGARIDNHAWTYVYPNVTEDMVLYADFSNTIPMLSSTILYNANGGTGSEIFDVVAYGSNIEITIRAADTYERPGYTFLNWKNRYLGDEYEAGSTIDASGKTVNLALDAQWAANSYTVKFDANGGDGAMADQEFTYDESQALAKNAFTNTGRAFAGWNTKADGTGTAYADGEEVRNLTTDGETTLYAQWSTGYCTVTFNTGLGSSVAPQTVEYGTTATKPADPQLSGHAFGGWYADEERTQAFDFATEITTDQTLYAKWNANSYTVEFDSNADGTIGTMAGQEFTYGVKQPLAENNFARTGYIFIEWNTAADGSGRSYADAVEASNLTADPNGTITLYAQWEPNTYVVEFASDSSEEEPVEGLMDGQTFTYDEEQALLKNNFTRDGFEFVGWNTEEDGSGIAYGDEEVVKNLTAEPSGYVGLWAQWNKISKVNFKVEFNANGGEGEMVAQEIRAGEAADLAGNAFTRAGYAFVGWNTVAQPTEENPGTAYADKEDAANLSAEEGETITLYAQWEQVYAVKIDAQPEDKGTISANLEQAAEGSVVTITLNPAEYCQLKAGTLKVKSESGVEIEISDSANTGTFIMPGEDVTVSAEFEWIPITSFRSVGKITIDEGETRDLNVSVHPATANPNVIWTSRDESIATATGFDKSKVHITGVKEGEVRVYAASAIDDAKKLWVNVTVVHHHSLSHVETKDATCTEPGASQEYWICDQGEHACGKVFSDSEATTEVEAETVVIPATGHDWGAWTKLDDEQHQRVCANDSEHVEKQNHDWDAGKVTKEPTQADEGIMTYTCTVCGATKTESIPKEEVKPEPTPDPTPTPEPGSDPNQKGTDGTAVGPGASAASADKAITGMTSDNDPKGSVYSKLKLKSTKQTKTTITLKWNKPSKAKKFVLYGNKCGTKNKMKKLATYTGSSKKLTKVAGKKIKKGTYYKFVMVALDKDNNVVSTSKVIHIATKGGKVTNPKSVTVKKGKKAVTKVAVKKGKTVTIKSTVAKVAKKLKLNTHRVVKYESSNTKIAKVITKNKVSKIKGIKKGTCYIYAYAQNGVAKRIKVTVK